MKQRVFIALGGTGGHIFPAVAFAEELKDKVPEIEIEFIGGKLATNNYFDRTKYPYHDVSCGKFTTNPLVLCKEMGKIVWGTFQSIRKFVQFRPQLIVGFGSYHSFPVLLAAKLAGIPFILHESNSIPGRVVRLFSPYAAITAVYFPAVRSLLKGNICSVKMPIRKNNFEEVSLKEARHHYHLNDTGFTILVFGGSQGAKIINETFFQTAASYLKTAVPDLQVIHLAGREEDCKTLSHRYQAHGVTASVKPFEKHMEMAWKSADLVISRAGACSIAEQIEFAVPGILIPFASALDDHQNANADFVAKNDMSTIVLEQNLTPEILAVAILKAKNNLMLMKQKIKDYKITLNVPSLVDLTIKHLSP